MIARIKGEVIEINLDSAVVMASGIGYLIYMTGADLSNLRLENEADLHIYQAVRENALDLYGFFNKETLDFFKLLISISGIGPKSALAILNTAPIESIKEGVASGDASHLTKVSGIGKKSAEKIIVELKDKIGSLDMHQKSNFEGGGMAIEALASLGYSEREAREVIQKIDRNLSTEEMVKEALRVLGGK